MNAVNAADDSGDDAPPAVPPKSPRPLLQYSTSVSVRQRAQTFTASSAGTTGQTAPLRYSPSTSRTQPAGTAARARESQLLLQRTASTSARSSPVAVVASTSNRASQGKRRREVVFCDVVVDELELGAEGEVVWPLASADFLNSQERVQVADEHALLLPRSRSATPRSVPTGRVDSAAVRRSLKELWQTEDSYLRKIQSLYNDFARPLRSFSRVKTTALISSYAATHLFINIEELVPISVAFERDLRQVANFVDKTRDGLPPRFGEMILHHVTRMHPFKRWLASHASSDALRRELERTSPQFRQYIEATQIGARESTRQTGGFTEMLAEPFQRVSRYRLMIDPIIAHLEQDDENVEPLLEAVALLTDICSMEVDEATRKAAALWSFMETIDGFPAALVGYERSFITCIDVDEILETSDPSTTSSRSATLRCTLFLFTDKLLIAKRSSPSSSFSSSTSSRAIAAAQTGRHLAGLDNMDHLVSVYQSSHLTSASLSHSVSGSPSKKSASSMLLGKKAALGYRGLVDLSAVASIDTAALTFSLLLDDPPSDQASERWCGRSTRHYVVATTYGAASADETTRAREKMHFLRQLEEAQVSVKRTAGVRGVWRTEGVAVEAGEVISDVYWLAWRREKWERVHESKRAKLALHFVDGTEGESGRAEDLAMARSGRPHVLAKAVFVEEKKVRFSVRTQGSNSSSAADVISLNRIPPAIADLGSTSNNCIPPAVRRSPSTTRQRPRSAIFSAALDVFSGAAASSLKRGHSQTSRASAATTTSWLSGSGGGTKSPSATSFFDGSSFGSASHDRDGDKGNRGRKLAQKSTPNLWGSVSSSAAPDERSRKDSRAMDFDDVRDEVGSNQGHAARSQSSLGAPQPSPARSRHRRSSSLPAPAQTRLATASPESASNAEFAQASPAASASGLDAYVSHMDAVEPISTSPVEYRPAPPARRRMMGPRAPGLSTSVYGNVDSSPARAIAARDYSPSPVRPTTEPLRLSDAVAASPASPVTPSANDSPPIENCAQSSASKRPSEASPRATPAKKIASFGEAASALPRVPSPTTTRRMMSSVACGSGTRVSSGSFAGARAPRSARRIVSNASTIRGMSPPARPERCSEMDVFDDAPELEMEEAETSTTPDFEMQDSMQDEAPPIDKLKRHIAELRSKMSFDLSNKENERILSPSGLARSPHTRNVSLKANTTPSSAFASSFVEGRKAGVAVDIPALLRWADSLSEMVDKLESRQESHARSRSVSPLPPSAPSCAEFATLEQERDLLHAEIKMLKEEVAKLVNEAAMTRQNIDVITAENTTLRSAYQDIVGEINVLYDEFNQRLGQVVETLQAEAGTTGSSDFSHHLQDAVLARTEAERQLAEYKRSVRSELLEKERYADMLRQAGLLPAA